MQALSTVLCIRRKLARVLTAKMVSHGWGDSLRPAVAERLLCSKEQWKTYHLSLQAFDSQCEVWPCRSVSTPRRHCGSAILRIEKLSVQTQLCIRCSLFRACAISTNCGQASDASVISLCAPRPLTERRHAGCCGCAACCRHEMNSKGDTATSAR